MSILFSPIMMGASVAGKNGNDANTQLLIHCDGADASTTLTDVSQNSFAVTANGNAQVDTAQSQFGGGSFLSDGSGDYLSIADDASLRPGSGDFTYDWWYRFSSTKQTHTILEKGYLGGADIAVQSTTGLAWAIFMGGGAVIIGSTSSVDTWYHFGLVRSSGTLTLYKDGVSDGSVANSTNISSTAELTFGGGTQASFEGWMDEIRYSNIARWTAPFTPPTVPYS